jgi:hypothetical protein
VAEITVTSKKPGKTTAQALVNVVEPFFLVLDYADISEVHDPSKKLFNSKTQVSSFSAQLSSGLNATHFTQN